MSEETKTSETILTHYSSEYPKLPTPNEEKFETIKSIKYKNFENTYLKFHTKFSEYCKMGLKNKNEFCFIITTYKYGPSAAYDWDDGPEMDKEPNRFFFDYSADISLHKEELIKRIEEDGTYRVTEGNGYNGTDYIIRPSLGSSKKRRRLD